MTDQTPGTDAGSGFITAPGFPAPDGIELVWIDDVGSLRIRAAFMPAHTGVTARGAVLFCTGYNEFIEKYFEAARDLQKRGFAVGMFDWPGQGASTHLHPNRRLGHVLSHDINVTAQLRVFQAMQKRFPGPYLVMAHSMGGAVTIESLRRGVLDVRAAMLSAPMLGLPVSVGARLLARVLRSLGFGSFPVGKSGRPETFETNPFTHDEARWRMKMDLLAQRPDYLLTSPTFAWVNAAFDLYREWGRRGAFNDFGTPAIVASASEDTIVSNGAQALVVAKMGSEAKFIPIPGARHEILMETDEIRSLFWATFDQLCAEVSV